MEFRIQVPKSILTVLNQLYELEQKLRKHGDPANFSRNIDKMKDAFAEEGLQASGLERIRLVYEDPIGQSCDETRTDLEATIAGSGTDNLVVVEVIKPIVRAIVRDGFSFVVQKGIVIVESRTKTE
jgi:hypothetical protein